MEHAWVEAIDKKLPTDSRIAAEIIEAARKRDLFADLMRLKFWPEPAPLEKAVKDPVFMMQICRGMAILTEDE